VIPPPAGEGSLPALIDGAAGGPGGQGMVPGGPTAQNMIDVAQIQGQVHAQSVHRVGELAERNPNETAAIVRQWLSEPAV
jgi:flagellar M-ring protein FliF